MRQFGGYMSDIVAKKEVAALLASLKVSKFIGSIEKSKGSYMVATNYVDDLDPALIRRGRMDNQIEMSYCRFEAFKVLAKNYLEIESHDLYGEIKGLLEETDMSHADVAENLMPKSDEEEAETCLKRLVKSLEEEKVKARKSAEEEEKTKAKEAEKETVKTIIRSNIG